MGTFFRNIVVLVMAVCFFWPPQAVFAHASLIQSSPMADASLDESPDEIVLTFNERLERELFYIKVFDRGGESVTAAAATMNQEQSEIRLALPELQDGLYTVTYKVISADGHPVSASYVFTIGEQAVSVPPLTDHSGHHQHELSGEIDLKQLITFVSRIVYFLSLLLLAGWTFWRIAGRFRSPVLEQDDLRWSLHLQRLFLLSVVFMVAVHLPDYVDTFAFQDVAALLTGTWIGLSWVSSFILSLLGFAVLHRSRWIGAVWIVLLLGAKSISGHAMAFEPVLRTVVLDFIHLVAASVWAGGLFYILVHWRNHKEALGGFIPKFSFYALISIVVLAVTGISSTLIYLPRLSYLQYTQWGSLLLAKCALVLLVIVAGAVLRYLIRKKREQHFGAAVKLDVGLMLLIVGITSIFTYLSPQPANEPLYWHVMGEKVHMTAKISPNAPGNNVFTVEVSMPQGSGEPKSVRLLLKNLDNEAVAPIEVSFSDMTVDDSLEFIGLEQFNYETEGPYLPFAGRWMLEVRVMDPDDNEFVYEKEFMIY